MIKHFYLIHWWDPNRYYHSGSEWLWEYWQWRWFSVISRTLDGKGLNLLQGCSWYILQLQATRLFKIIDENYDLILFYYVIVLLKTSSVHTVEGFPCVMIDTDRWQESRESRLLVHLDDDNDYVVVVNVLLCQFIN